MCYTFFKNWWGIHLIQVSWNLEFYLQMEFNLPPVTLDSFLPRSKSNSLANPDGSIIKSRLGIWILTPPPLPPRSKHHPFLLGSLQNLLTHLQTSALAWPLSSIVCFQHSSQTKTKNKSSQKPPTAFHFIQIKNQSPYSGYVRNYN